MRIPVTVNKNTLQTYNDYRSDTKWINSLQSNNLSDWDQDVPKSLQEICLEAIASNWEANPILEEIPLVVDHCFLLDVLPTALPLTLTVPKIDDDIYWKRCYVEKWPKSIPNNVQQDFQITEIVKNGNGNGSRKHSSSTISRDFSTNKRKWKECFLEMYIRDYLEKLKPEEYDAEKMKELSDLCSNFVKNLDLRELQASENSSNRIPLNAIVTGLENLTELSICFKQTYVGEKFTWDVVRIPVQDIKLLAKGIEKCNLKVFRLKNSEIDDEKATIIMKSLLKHDLQTLDFSHCRLSDDASVALSKFCLHNSVQELILANNRIGPKGVEALCFALCQRNSLVTLLDLKLNPLGDTGAGHLMKLLQLDVRNMKSLLLNGCGIKNLPALGDMIEHNSSLDHLNISNNCLGQEMGKIILQGLRYNTSLTKLDVRMCKLSPEDEFSILQRIDKNKIAKRCPRTKKKPIIIEPQYSFEITEELLSEIENAFEKINEPEEDEAELVEAI